MIDATAANHSYLVFRRDPETLFIYMTDKTFSIRYITIQKIVWSLEKVEFA